MGHHNYFRLLFQRHINRIAQDFRIYLTWETRKKRGYDRAELLVMDEPSKVPVSRWMEITEVGAWFEGFEMGCEKLQERRIEELAHADVFVDGNLIHWENEKWERSLKL